MFRSDWPRRSCRESVTGESSVLAFDARHNELVKLDARTRTLRWRLALGEPVGDPPLVLGNQLVQVLPSGKLLLIALESGELQSTVNLGRPLARAAGTRRIGPAPLRAGTPGLPVRAAARSALVYRGRLSRPRGRLDSVCDRAAGTVSGDPRKRLFGGQPVARLDRRRIRSEGASRCRNSRFPAGLGPRPRARARLSGPPETRAVTRRLPWEITGPRSPFRSVARLAADAVASGPAFALARSDRELWVASGHAGRFELDAERGKIETKVPLAQPGPALAPIQSSGRLVVMTFR